MFVRATTKIQARRIVRLSCNQANNYLRRSTSPPFTLKPTMSGNNLSAKTLSSISRDKANAYMHAFLEPGMESILGKRKSELQPLADVKRHATTSLPKPKVPTKEAYNTSHSGSPSSTSDINEHERLEHDGRADLSRGSFHPWPLYPLRRLGRFFYRLLSIRPL